MSSTATTIFFQFNKKKFLVNKANFQEESNYEKYKDVDLINLNLEFGEMDGINDSVIEDFANYFNEKYSCFTFSNIVPLSILAQRFKVQTLIQFTNNYKEKHTAQIVKDFFETSKHLNLEYEELIAKVFPSFLTESSLLNFPIPCIYRIIQIYLQNDNSINKDIINFMFKYFEANSNDSSVIFGLIDRLDDDDEEDEFLRRIYVQYKDDFNFSFLKPSHTIFLFYKNMKLVDKIHDFEYQEHEIENLENTIKSLKEDSLEFLTKLKEKIQKKIDYDY